MPTTEELLARIVELLEAADRRQVTGYVVPCPACAAPPRQLCSARDGTWMASPHSVRTALARGDIDPAGADRPSWAPPPPAQSPYTVACPVCHAPSAAACVRTSPPVGEVMPTVHPVRSAIARGQLGPGLDLPAPEA